MKVLVILAVLAAVLGTFTLSQATLGVGIIGLGCLAGILARVAQAEAHHSELRKSQPNE